MNVIEFDVQQDGQVDVLIDGASASELLDAGLVQPDEFAVLVERWRNRSATAVRDYDAPSGWVPFLTCNCRVWGCGGVAMKVETARGTIKWFDISSPDGTVALGVGPFVFAWDQFEDARQRTQTLLDGGRSRTVG